MRKDDDILLEVDSCEWNSYFLASSSWWPEDELVGEAEHDDKLLKRTVVSAKNRLLSFLVSTAPELKLVSTFCWAIEVVFLEVEFKACKLSDSFILSVAVE